MDSIHLDGAEDVRRAGNTISSAADTMRSAAGEIDGSMDRFKNFMEDWLQRFEAVVAKTEREPVLDHSGHKDICTPERCHCGSQ